MNTFSVRSRDEPPWDTDLWLFVGTKDRGQAPFRTRAVSAGARPPGPVTHALRSRGQFQSKAGIKAQLGPAGPLPLLSRRDHSVPRDDRAFFLFRLLQSKHLKRKCSSPGEEWGASAPLTMTYNLCVRSFQRYPLVPGDETGLQKGVPRPCLRSRGGRPTRRPGSASTSHVLSLRGFSATQRARPGSHRRRSEDRRIAERAGALQ